MIDPEELARLQRVELAETDRERLADLLEVTLEGDTPQERLNSLLRQLKNPYCFRVGRTAARLSFRVGGAELEETLRRYFLMLKRRGPAAAGESGGGPDGEDPKNR